MNVLLLVKQVPDTEARIKVNPDGKNIVTDGVKYILSPYDEFVVEEGVRIKEKHGGEVVAITAGPARAKELLTTCLAVGADKGVHVSDTTLAGGDSFATAEALAAACRKFQYDVILCGKKAVGVDRGITGPAVAQMLGVPFVSNIVKLEFSDDKKKATVTSEVEGGTEVYEVELPAVFSCQKGLNVLRHVSLPGIMKAKTKPKQELKAADLGVSDAKASAKLRMAGMAYPPERKSGRVLQGDPQQAVDELMRLLHEEAKVI
ncbi:MAG TPA: electron transfer flavoprotein subunit beta/FixA family protein [Candidatus Xenobia bacterium]|jgi:electron transfer flavoprotein beta subunit